ncbi:hypothetical protein GOODEAATRI_027838 [Goodea atripinnis]|uniref:Uncharacterized protein n=1 Tax=Goodea atripinnis TaxID=208336 RepID=A0ABV0MN78_9TELE
MWQFGGKFIKRSMSLYRFFQSGPWGSWCLSPAVYGGGVHPGPVSNHAHTHSHLERPINLTGMWEEAGVPRENTRIYGENMQIPCRKTPGSHQSFSYFEHDFYAAAVNFILTEHASFNSKTYFNT